MNNRKILINLSMTAMLAAATAAIAHADVITPTTVNATTSVYLAGSNAGNANSDAGTAPSDLAILSGATSVTFSVPSGQTVTVNTTSGDNLNDPDGVGSASGETNTGTSNLSGITAPTAGFIAGVFIGPSGPGSATAPAALDFTSSGTSFSSLSPLLNQVFFIGDGMTGDGTGPTQTFVIPTGATGLYLGLTDACNYSGGPSCYGDNAGTFSLTYTEVGASTSPVPEPSSLVLLGTGALGIAGTVRRRFARR